MNLRVIAILLAVFFLSLVCVSAADENITNDDMGYTNIDYNVSSSGVDDELLGVNVDSAEEEVLSVSVDDNVSSSGVDDELLGVNVDSAEEEVLSVSVGDNISSASVNESKLSANVEDTSKLSKSNGQQVVSMSVSQQNSKLSSIYDHVYSHKEWKSIILVKFKVKKSWSKHKRDKKIRKYWKKALKKSKRLVKKYTRKGWIYDGRLWTWQVGRYAVHYQYYVQFYQTRYYNGYGERIA